jgi:hypothetical protein
LPEPKVPSGFRDPARRGVPLSDRCFGP